MMSKQRKTKLFFTAKIVMYEIYMQCRQGVNSWPLLGLGQLSSLYNLYSKFHFIIVIGSYSYLVYFTLVRKLHRKPLSKKTHVWINLLWYSSPIGWIAFVMIQPLPVKEHADETRVDSYLGMKFFLSFWHRNQIFFLVEKHFFCRASSCHITNNTTHKERQLQATSTIR